MDIEEFWRPFEVSIDSFDQLVEKINSVMRHAADRDVKFAWRGQIDAGWALHSSLYRRLSLTKNKAVDEEDLSTTESKILVELHRWGLHSSASTGRLSILNQLAMLQHYGSPTRLIDITFNAWVGAWFAVEQKWSNGKVVGEDSDARLFAFDVTDRLINENDQYRSWEDDLGRPWKHGEGESISKKEWTTSVFAWKPANLDARISAQNGGFLFGGVPATNKPDNKKFQFPKTPDFKDGWWKINEGRQACCLAMRPHVFEPKAGKGANSGALYTFRIKADAKKDIRQRLAKMFGYKHSTIYPDYTGFASFGFPELKNY